MPVCVNSSIEFQIIPTVKIDQMKRLLLAILILSAFLTSYGQSDSLKKLDINLENYLYPYPVRFLKLNNQQQEIQMAYMDVTPKNYNGKNVLLLHGKNFNGAYWATTIAALAKEGFRESCPTRLDSASLQSLKLFNTLFSNCRLIQKLYWIVWALKRSPSSDIQWVE